MCHPGIFQTTHYYRLKNVRGPGIRITIVKFLSLDPGSRPDDENAGVGLGRDGTNLNN